MGRSVICAVALCTCAHMSVCAQTFNTRNDYLNLQGSEVGWAVEKVADGYLLYQGYSPDTIPGARVSFTRLDATGQVENSWGYGDTGTVQTCGWANSLDRTASGGFAACGTLGIDSLDFSFVWSFDMNGDTLWTRQLFAEPGFGSLGWMAKGLSDGSVVATGRVFPPDIWSQAFLMKLGPQGDSLWTRTYGGSATDASYSVDLTHDGGFVLGGYTTSYDGGDQQTYG